MLMNYKKEKWKIRRKIERIFAWAKRWGNLGKARYLGLWRTEIQALATIFLWNAKILSYQSAGP